MTFLRAVLWLLLAACAFVVISAAIGRWSVVADSFGIWLIYGTIGAGLLTLLFAVSRSGGGTLFAALVGIAGLAHLWPHIGADAALAEGSGAATIYQQNVFYENPTSGLAERIAGADIVMLQEVEAAVPAVEALAADWTVNICPNLGVGSPVIATRLPVAGSGCFEGGAWQRIETPDGPATFLSLHLQRPWPWPQPAQLIRTLDDMAELDRPVIVAGDFNAGTWSDAVARVAAATGTRVIDGIDVTRVGGGGLMRMPIDHVLLPEGWSGTSTPGGSYGSDHREVTATVAAD